MDVDLDVDVVVDVVVELNVDVCHVQDDIHVKVYATSVNAFLRDGPS